MSVKPTTYVRRVTNLSDARYCAGMGVDLLGYVVDPADDDYVSPKLYQEMSGWVSGPRRVIEIVSPLDTTVLLDQYRPDLLHISFGHLGIVELTDLPLILECDYKDCDNALRKVSMLGFRTEYLLVTGLKGQSFQTDFHPVLIDIGVEPQPWLTLIRQYDADGIAMTGTREQAPGLKDYDHLAKVLEDIDGM